MGLVAAERVGELPTPHQHPSSKSTHGYRYRLTVQGAQANRAVEVLHWRTIRGWRAMTLRHYVIRRRILLPGENKRHHGPVAFAFAGLMFARSRWLCKRSNFVTTSLQGKPLLDVVGKNCALPRTVGQHEQLCRGSPFVEQR